MILRIKLTWYMATWVHQNLGTEDLGRPPLEVSKILVHGDSLKAVKWSGMYAFQQTLIGNPRFMSDPDQRLKSIAFPQKVDIYMVEDIQGFHLTLVGCWRKDLSTYWLVPSLSVANNRRPFWSREAGKGARQLPMCDLRRGMFGCALLHRWQRNSIDKMSSSFNVARPNLSISSITSTESRKKALLKEFQCFLFLRCFESKSWLITWRCNCRIDGACKKREFKMIFTKTTYWLFV